MNGKQKKRMAVDVLMTAALLLLMPYGMVGETAHEWIGAGMLVLFILHHVLNRKWLGGMRKGKYTPVRILQTVLAAAVLVCMIGSMFSGIVLSRHVFSFLRLRGLTSLAQPLHMACAYWGFALMSLHLGIHWGTIIRPLGRRPGSPSAGRPLAARLAGAAVAAYGVWAFWKRSIGSYMFLRVHFVFFDYSEPLVFFLLDYAAVMGLFVWIGHYLSALLRKAGKSGRAQADIPPG